MRFPNEARTVVLVEGLSDQRAVETLAARLGRDLAADGVAVVAMGGATNVGRFISRFAGAGLRVSGLVDEAQAPVFARAVERAGLGADLAGAGFFVCVADLEDELIRALGPERVEDVLDAEGDLALFRKFQGQPAQRGKPAAALLRRFLGTRSGRKIHYGRVLVAAVELDRVPAPLERLLARI